MGIFRKKKHKTSFTNNASSVTCEVIVRGFFGKFPQAPNSLRTPELIEIKNLFLKRVYMAIHSERVVYSGIQNVENNIL